VVGGVASLVKLGLPQAHEFDITYQLASEKQVMGLPGQIYQVFLELAFNARDAMPRGGTMRFSTQDITLLDKIVDPYAEIPRGDYVLTEVIDSGTGIAENSKRNVFDTGYTTKPTGTGLGLAVVKRIVQNHEGYIVVDSKKGEGTSFKVYMPAHDGPEEMLPL